MDQVPRKTQRGQRGLKIVRTSKKRANQLGRLLFDSKLRNYTGFQSSLLHLSGPRPLCLAFIPSL